MERTTDQDALLKAAAIIDLIDAGWQPGTRELHGAAYVEDWSVLRSNDGIPFRLLGICLSPPRNFKLVVAPLLAFDRIKRWARTRDEWLVIGDPLKGSTLINSADVRLACAGWLLKELGQQTGFNPVARASALSSLPQK
jgi:hypothetical protein